MMQSKLIILLTGLLLICVARATLAGEQGFVLWDQNIASAVSAGLPHDGRCSASPYALYGQSCHNTLNLSFDRPINYFSFLDRAALFLHKYHELKYNQSLWDNTKLRFHVNLKNVYKQEARAGMELRIRFSSSPLRQGLLSQAGRIALAPPLVEQN
jgi:hypothetical protein